MFPWLMVLIAGACVALIALFMLFPRRRVHRRRNGGRHWLRVLFGLPLLLLGIALCLLGISLRNYFMLEGEIVVAQIVLKQTGVQRYSAELSAAGQVRSFDLAGDEWQLDARLLTWKLPALLAGVKPLYRLERLQGRYGDVKQELDAPRTVYSLHRGGELDLWTLKRQYPKALPFADAQFGSAAYLPMLDNARYSVSLGPRGGLVARPADAATHDLLVQSGWLQE